MKIMSYNIRLGIQEGIEAIAEVIAAEAPDIVALQEVGNGWRMGPNGDTTAEIARLAGYEYYYYVATIFEEPDFRYGHAILSRWPLDSHEVVDFSQSIDEPRAAIVARILSPDGPIQVIATHLSHKPEERALQAPELIRLRDTVRTSGEPVLLLGDLNETPEVAWMQALADGMASAMRLTSAPTFPNPTPTIRIDHIMMSDATLTRAAVISEDAASDHRPLVAEFNLGATEQ
ncbi:endonuclease/exonuclease/phosphatase family protein [Bradymonas sediminis]|uniref:Uncharacterized protein n=1 Tax=Bradymonas sediminis TaxID=1548548 RepID=A0A2Z4FK46_9DELT|nr:endonuclease/exonuclease/phosphatase family protein [Bradymonas sediminis]AWV89250.1 hypothetical protein DN745_07810 [Bradymonas sediminis]TDP73420.1 endonuclease/exonuclease/phosphatase family metal-dependent hydrolase [Bradymonas sediminis]